jgi:hypothetical protein
MPSRRAHVARCTSLGSIAQRRASSEVMNSAPSRSRNSRKWTSVMAGSWSFVPRARRSATYCTRASCMAFSSGTSRSLATAGQPRAMPRRIPGRRSRWWSASDAGGPPRSSDMEAPCRIILVARSVPEQMGSTATRAVDPGSGQRPPYNMANCRRSRQAITGRPHSQEDPPRRADATVFAKVQKPEHRQRPRAAAYGPPSGLCRGRRSLQPANECRQVRARRLHPRADRVEQARVRSRGLGAH